MQESRHDLILDFAGWKSDSGFGVVFSASLDSLGSSMENSFLMLQ